MTLMQRVVTIAGVVAVVGLSAVGSGPALAQTADEGVVWAFAQEEPFFDDEDSRIDWRHVTWLILWPECCHIGPRNASERRRLARN